jgi:hypothetical protein
MRRIPNVALTLLIAIPLIGVMQSETVSAQVFLQCHDDSRDPIHNGHWTHGDPNTGLPGDPRGNNGYYYLAITACTTTLTGGADLTGIVHGKAPRDGIHWRIDITPDYDSGNRLAIAYPIGNSADITYTGAKPGAHYRLRIANLTTGVTITDHGYFDG